MLDNNASTSSAEWEIERRCKLLWFRVLAVAYKDAIYGHGKRLQQRNRIKKEAREWLASDLPHFGSAFWICELLGEPKIQEQLVYSLLSPRSPKSKQIQRGMLAQVQCLR